MIGKLVPAHITMALTDSLLMARLQLMARHLAMVLKLAMVRKLAMAMAMATTRKLAMAHQLTMAHKAMVNIMDSTITAIRTTMGSINMVIHITPEVITMTKGTKAPRLLVTVATTATPTFEGAPIALPGKAQNTSNAKLLLSVVPLMQLKQARATGEQCRALKRKKSLQQGHVRSAMPHLAPRTTSCVPRVGS